MQRPHIYINTSEEGEAGKKEGSYYKTNKNNNKLQVTTQGTSGVDVLDDDQFQLLGGWDCCAVIIRGIPHTVSTRPVYIYIYIYFFLTLKTCIFFFLFLFL